MSGPLVVGIDLSLTATGLASSDGWTKLHTSTGHRDDTWKQRDERIRDLFYSVTADSHDADLIVIEGPSYSSNDPSFFDRAYLWWSVYHSLTVGWSRPVAVMTPSAVKKYATGKGTASKGAVVDACARRAPQFDTGGDDNLADAVWLMAAGRDYLGHPVVAVPSVNREALAKVQWPEGGAP